MTALSSPIPSAASLSQQQQQAFSALQEFIHSSSRQSFLLNGYAGTGKTFLMRELVRWLQAEKRKVYLLAPTGRAARILQEKTGHEAATIHRSIYQFSKEGIDRKDTYQVVFSLAQNTTPGDAIFIVDEASMVADLGGHQEMLRFGSGRLLKDLATFVDPLHSDRKLIFCGDDAQLPPIGMNFSPALDEEYLQQEFGWQSARFTLSQVVRQQAGNSILNMAGEVRGQISRAVSNRVHIGADGRHVGEQPVERLRQAYAMKLRARPFPETTWICYTNKATGLVNKDMRDLLGYFHHPIETDELLMVTQNNYTNELLLMNGDLIRVKEASERSERFTVIFNYKERQKLRKELVFRDIRFFHPAYPGQEQRIKVLESSLTDTEPDLLNVAQFVLCQKQHKESGQQIDFETFKQDSPYMKALHVRYGYAITCHKAQGGEWGEVIADLKHSAGAYSGVFLRWAYTAITRASMQLWILNPVHADALSGFVVGDIHPLKRTRRAVPAELSTEAIEIAEDDPEVYHQYPFLKPAAEAMQEKAAAEGIKLELDFMQYRLRLTASGDEGRECIWDLTFGNKKLNLKPVLRSATPEAFGRTARQITAAADTTAAAPQEEAQPVRPPEQEHKRQLHVLLERLGKHVGVRITGFIEEAWCDVWLLHTDVPGAELACFYNKHQRYTSLQPRSKKGPEDQKLHLLLQQLSNR